MYKIRLKDKTSKLRVILTLRILEKQLTLEIKFNQFILLCQNINTKKNELNY